MLLIFLGPIPMPQRHAAQPTPPPQPLLPEMNSEAVACKWLQSQFEYSTGVFTRMELYTEYLSACTRAGIKNVTNSTSFSNCVRMAFPKVDSTRVEREDGTGEVHYKGLDRRKQPLPFPTPQKGEQ